MTSAIQNITSSLPSLGRARLLINSADDVVIVSAVRTPVTKVSSAIPSYGDMHGERPKGHQDIEAELTYRPRRAVSKTAFPRTSSRLSSKRPSSEAVLTPPRFSE
mgnify:CR=1 FL=1|jgi:hypothetical protein